LPKVSDGRIPNRTYLVNRETVEVVGSARTFSFQYTDCSPGEPSLQKILIRNCLTQQEAALRFMFVRYGLTLASDGEIVGVAATFVGRDSCDRGYSKWDRWIDPSYWNLRAVRPELLPGIGWVSASRPS